MLLKIGINPTIWKAIPVMRIDGSGARKNQIAKTAPMIGTAVNQTNRNSPNNQPRLSG